MALFERENADFRSDVATRALSVTVVENQFVEHVYDNLAKVYDLTFGPALHPGRLVAIERMGVRLGDQVLEVGVGTGINASLYPSGCSVTGIDLSASMLEKARGRSRSMKVWAPRSDSIPTLTKMPGGSLMLSRAA